MKTRVSLKYFVNYCRQTSQAQLIETFSKQNDDDINKSFVEREKYWRAQLFILSPGLNNPNKKYGLNVGGYQK